jgi:hypothetical protein
MDDKSLDPIIQRYNRLDHSYHIEKAPHHQSSLSHWRQGKDCKKDATLLASASVMGRAIGLMGRASSNLYLVGHRTYLSPANQHYVRNINEGDTWN